MRRIPFRIVVPLVYLLLAGLFLGGIIINIAEGSNPFGFLNYIVSYPSLLALDLLPRSTLWSELNGWMIVMATVLTNLIIHFLLGCF